MQAKRRRRAGGGMASGGMAITKRKRRLGWAASVTVAAGLAWLATAAAAADTPAGVEGLWLTGDHKGVVRIAPCGELLCGTVDQVLVKDPGAPTTDINNPDPRLRARPLLGLRILWGFHRDGAAWVGGRAYDPESGKSYRSSLAVDRDGALKVTGCVLIVCQSRLWARYRSSSTVAPARP